MFLPGSYTASVMLGSSLGGSIHPSGMLLWFSVRFLSHVVFLPVFHPSTESISNKPSTNLDGSAEGPDSSLRSYIRYVLDFLYVKIN